MKLSAFTSFDFSDSLENTVTNIEHYFNWFRLSNCSNSKHGTTLYGLDLSRTQILELMAAAHGYKSYASFKSENDKESLARLTQDFGSAVERVMARMNDILGVSNKLFVQMLVGSMDKKTFINPKYEFKIEASNLICFYIGNYSDAELSGIPKLAHLYMMVLNNIGLSIGLHPEPVQLHTNIYKHLVAETKSPIRDILKITSVSESDPHTVTMDIKLKNGKWVNLCNGALGNAMYGGVLGLSNGKKKLSIDKAILQNLRGYLNGCIELKDVMPQMVDSKLKVLNIYSNSLDCISDFLQKNLSYSFGLPEGEEGIYGAEIDERSVELLDTYTAIFEIDNSDITVEVEISAFMPTVIELSETGLNIKPMFNQCVEIVVKTTALSNQDGSDIVPDFWTELSSSNVELLNNLYGQLIPNLRKAKYLFACAMDNIQGVDNQTAA